MEQVPLSGVVLDSEGTPVPGCSVSSTHRQQENAIITNDTGRFETSVIPGNQKISATCPDVSLEGEVTVEVTTAGKDDVKITVN